MDFYQTWYRHVQGVTFYKWLNFGVDPIPVSLWIIFHFPSHYGFVAWNAQR